MAEPIFSLDADTQPPALLGKTDALIARHRGHGLDPNVPVLTDLDAADIGGDIPVLTQVASVLDDELMFTPEEIRAEPPSSLDEIVDTAPPKVHSAATPVASPAPTIAAPRAPQAALVDSMIEVPQYKPASKPAAPVAAPAPDFDFPDLTIPVSKPAPKPSVATTSPVAMGDGPLMPDLALNFDFALPPDDLSTPSLAAPVAATPAPAPAVVQPAPVPQAAPVSATITPSAVAAPRTDATRLVSEAFPDLSIELDAALAESDVPTIDTAALAEQLIASLRPEIEALVKQELKRQVTAFYAESVKRTLGTLQPQLDKLIHSHIEDALKRH